MQKKNSNNMIRIIVDVCMTVVLLFLMAYQVTGEVVHEWTCCSVHVWHGSRVTRKENASRNVSLVLRVDGTAPLPAHTGDDL